MTTKFKPVFDSKQTGYDRIAVTPTHFNKNKFKGSISKSEANIIGHAIGLHELDNNYGISFHRSEEDTLFLMYKLKKNMSLQEFENSLPKCFWFD